jgi:hypothetical protein
MAADLETAVAARDDCKRTLAADLGTFDEPEQRPVLGSDLGGPGQPSPEGRPARLTVPILNNPTNISRASEPARKEPTWAV